MTNYYQMHDTTESRQLYVEAMDYSVHQFDDEELIMTWLMLGCPDCSTEEDYNYFATDEEAFNELTELYLRLKKLDMEG